MHLINKKKAPSLQVAFDQLLEVNLTIAGIKLKI